jgi:uncharacterized protein (DUF1330 family)
MVFVKGEQLPAYAIANLRDVRFGDEIVRYMHEIDATLEPFGGEFVVHGGPLDAVEGDWGGDIVIIRFPDRASARAWYDSPGYRAILPLRLENSSSETVIVEGVKPGHTARQKVDELLRG